jgi:hypothetical protein
MRLNEMRLPLQRGGKATLFIFSDMQWGTEGFSEEMWNEFEGDFRSTKNAYAIGLGDYDDWVRWTVRRPMTDSTAGDGSVRKRLDKMVMTGVDELARKMSFMKGRLVGLHSGHHEWDFATGANSTEILCQKLDATYLGWLAYSVIKVGSCKPNAAAYSFKIFSTHGSGGAMFSSADLGNLEKKIAPYWIADLYLRGHSSKLEMIPMELNDVTVNGPEPKLIKRTRWLVNCGGFMAGYVVGEDSYVERNNMPPAAQGYAKCEIQLTNHLKDAMGHDMTGVRLQPMLVSPNVTPTR